MAENEVVIPLDYFDFYEHSQLKELSEQTTYLTDVVGIIKRHEDFRDLENKHGQKQKQSKLVITDGRSNVNITFWDSFGIKFETDMKQVVQKPVIIIISCCRVGKWDGEIDISNVPATRIYLNYKHHVVDQLRKRLANPDFVKQALAEKKKMEILLMKIEDIKKLGKEYIDVSGCWKEIKLENSIPVCEPCNRFVPYPEIRYRISVKAEDATGEVQVILGDREVRTLILKRARQLLEEHAGSGDMPQCLKTLAGKDYSVVLNIKEMNISKSFHVYWASNICNGFIRWGEKNRTDTTSTQNQPTTSTNTGQTTTSTYTGQGISDLDLAST
ncbi:hypothetical protein DCAR_0519475 [Daucus carota subsp. sativus]|uniref:Replication protein A OB domain-containing protein n=1 Tax=Daucus carota subsp. sativus TaxID=79200 RepID=A0AAF0X2E5_DAUCS|nr:hypothetical protein DCAR_0519475 [Daucus carota subsp. sativus]